MTKKTKSPSENASRPAAKKGKKGFQKGTSGNSAGRPIGSKNKSSRMASELLESHSEELVMAIIENAKAGDPTAQRLCIERITPPIRSRKIPIKLPKIRAPEDLVTAYGDLDKFFADEAITLDELERLSGLLENKRKAFETSVLAEDMLQLKEALGLSA